MVAARRSASTYPTLSTRSTDAPLPAVKHAAARTTLRVARARPDGRDTSGLVGRSPPLHRRPVTPYIYRVPSGTMGINALVISGSDPGAVPGGSTNHPSLGGQGAEIGSTNV